MPAVASVVCSGSHDPSLLLASGIAKVGLFPHQRPCDLERFVPALEAHTKTPACVLGLLGLLMAPRERVEFHIGERLDWSPCCIVDCTVAQPSGEKLRHHASQGAGRRTRPLSA